MTITVTIDGKQPRDATRQVVFFTVKVKSKELKFSDGSVPVLCDTDAKILTHLKAKTDKYYRLLLGKEYKGAEPWDFNDPKKSDLQNFDDWISNGHKNKIQVGVDEKGKPIFKYKLIEKREYKGNHPKWIEDDKAIDKAKTLDELKTILKNVIRS